MAPDHRQARVATGLVREAVQCSRANGIGLVELFYLAKHERAALVWGRWE